MERASRSEPGIELCSPDINFCYCVYACGEGWGDVGFEGQLT